jgi:UDP-N-acetylglucosamine 1-carboxyvinyltransferase
MLGVKIKDDAGLIICDGSHMHPADIHLDYPSVGATENIMMTAVHIAGETNIHNTAREPEIEDLQLFLRGIGCDVSGAGTSHIRVRGTNRESRPYAHRVIPDRIVTGTLLCAAAITGGEITLENVRPGHLGAVLSKLSESGCELGIEEDKIHIVAPQRLSEIKLIETLPHPGFPTDMQAQFFSLCTLARGTSVVVENVFENRFKHGPELARMGALFTQRDRTIIIRGVEALNGTTVTAHDLRGGAALTLAGLAAKGQTEVLCAEQIDRGYLRLEDMLNQLGADVRRED